jgi:ribosome-associated toxin RatA of RatAB toxin-antitoxin module
MSRTALVALTCTVLLGSDAAAAGPAHHAPSVSVRDAGAGAYVVAASFEVAHPAAIARAVLTDYANIPKFVPDIQTSVVLARSDGVTRVEQEAVSKFLMFSKRVHLQLAIHEQADVIAFRDECGRSFKQYAGSWRLTEKDGTTRVDYELTAEPAFDVPDFLVARVLSRDAKDMIERLRAEMGRRAAAGRAP